ncbi:MAG: hypothetical protein CME06_05970 [Gemmatimonadetes bacterium]|nr:hypothetical protein [Gemmatimonadota bacterium]
MVLLGGENLIVTPRCLFPIEELREGFDRAKSEQRCSQSERREARSVTQSAIPSSRIHKLRKTGPLGGQSAVDHDGELRRAESTGGSDEHPFLERPPHAGVGLLGR